MNAELISKSAKGMALASGLALVTSVQAFANNAPVPLGAPASTPLTAFYANPPTGAVTLGGRPFAMANFDWLAPGQTGTFAASYPSPTGVYVLLNSSYTNWQYAGLKVGTVVLTFSDGTTQSVDLVEGKNVREWNMAAGGTVNTVTDPANTVAWTDTTATPPAPVIDMLTISVPTTTKSLSSVTVTDIDPLSLNIHLQVNGLSVSYTPPAPAPKPTAKCDDETGQHGGQHENSAKASTHKECSEASEHSKHSHSSKSSKDKDSSKPSPAKDHDDSAKPSTHHTNDKD